jgi:CRISPR-associated protein Cmr1
MTTDSLEIGLTTVTPLWTGGADGKADRLHAPGIVGSLRWWYEVMVRGLGGNACDPGEHSCLYDSKTPPNNGLCDVCRVFGTTGWARRFRLVVTDETQLRSASPWERRVTASRSYKDRLGKEKSPTWFFDNPPLIGNANIKIVATDNQFQTEIIGGLIQFLVSWASIGARPQMGYGVIATITRQDTLYLLNHLQAVAGPRIEKELPSLQNLFLTSISPDRFPQNKTFPKNETFNLKYDLRRLFAANDNLRHFIMGEAPQQGERQGAKIMMSRPYQSRTSGQSTIRIWGWIPEGVMKFGVSREEVIKQIHDHLNSHYTVGYWREFNSERDTERQYADPQEFLRSLLGLEGKA